MILNFTQQINVGGNSGVRKRKNTEGTHHSYSGSQSPNLPKKLEASRLSELIRRVELLCAKTRRTRATLEGSIHTVHARRSFISFIYHAVLEKQDPFFCRMKLLLKFSDLWNLPEKC